MVLLKRGINPLPFDGGRTVEEMRMEQPVSFTITYSSLVPVPQ